MALALNEEDQFLVWTDSDRNGVYRFFLSSSNVSFLAIDSNATVVGLTTNPETARVFVSLIVAQNNTRVSPISSEFNALEEPIFYGRGAAPLLRLCAADCHRRVVCRRLVFCRHLWTARLRSLSKRLVFSGIFCRVRVLACATTLTTVLLPLLIPFLDRWLKLVLIRMPSSSRRQLSVSAICPLIF